MPDLDLEPHEYRRKGVHRFVPHPLDGKSFTYWGIACGVWAGLVIGTARYFISGDNPWVVATIALAPGAVWGLRLLLADKP